MKRIGILGTGGVGGYFGARMIKNLSPEEAAVSFVARGNHLAAIREKGLVVKTQDDGIWTVSASLATDRPEDLDELDLVLLCVKAFDLPEVLARLKKSIRPETWILPLLNGVDIPDRVRSALPDANVLSACVYIGTHIESPGVINQKGGACRILWGPYDRQPPQWISTLLDNARISHSCSLDPAADIWSKYIFITSYGLMTAVYGETLGGLLAKPDLSAELRNLIDEVTAVGRAMGVELPEDIETQSYEKGFHFPPETKTSFQRDYENPDKRDERDLFGGTVLKLAELNGVDVPVTNRLYGRLI